MIAIEETTKVQPDGTVLVRRPELIPGAEVKVILLLPDEVAAPPSEPAGEPYAFLKVLENANLDGPPDWSEHLDDYVYRNKSYDGQPRIS